MSGTHHPEDERRAVIECAHNRPTDRRDSGGERNLAISDAELNMSGPDT
jgi:hypothetical protein